MQFTSKGASGCHWLFYFIFLPSNKTELLSCSQWCSLEEEAPCVEESVSVQVCFTCLTLYTERRETDHDRHYDPRQLASDWAGTKKRVLDVSCLVPDCHRDVRIPLTSLNLKASFFIVLWTVGHRWQWPQIQHSCRILHNYFVKACSSALSAYNSSASAMI